MSGMGGMLISSKSAPNLLGSSSPSREASSSSPVQGPRSSASSNSSSADGAGHDNSDHPEAHLGHLYNLYAAGRSTSMPLFPPMSPEELAAHLEDIELPDDSPEEIIDDSNAQSLLPTEARIFVGNLLKDLSDNTLVKQLYDIFGPGGRIFSEKGHPGEGRCWITLKRNPRGIPYAFVQYRRKGEAMYAVQEGPSYIVGDRKLRTEFAEGYCTVYVSRKDGSLPSVTELETLFRPYGITVTTPSDSDRHINRLPVGRWVTFDFYGEFERYRSTFTGNPSYHVRFVRNPQESVGHQGRQGRFGPPISRRHNTYQHPAVRNCNRQGHMYAPPHPPSHPSAMYTNHHVQSGFAYPQGGPVGMPAPHNYVVQQPGAQIDHRRPFAPHPWGCPCPRCFY